VTPCSAASIVTRRSHSKSAVLSMEGNSMRNKSSCCTGKIKMTQTEFRCIQ